MKKLSPILFATVFIASVLVSWKQSGGKNEAQQDSTVSTNAKLVSPIQTSLNGISLADANLMVKAFIANKGKYERKTSVWFSRAYIDSLCALLESEQQADGIRFYLARKNKINTFILVTTTDDGPAPKAPSKRIHKDYFEHTAPFLLSALKEIRDEDGNDLGGARLFKTFDCSSDFCIKAEHYISCDTAKSWVTNFNGDSTINTNSEWFEKKLIFKIKRQLDNTPSADHPSGIRIYLGLKKSNNKSERRHVFIIVRTKKTTDASGNEINLDDYVCPGEKGTDDNGEQCPNNCKGATLPQP
jgi:hypothetical protein